MGDYCLSCVVCCVGGFCGYVLLCLMVVFFVVVCCF